MTESVTQTLHVAATVPQTLRWVGGALIIEHVDVTAEDVLGNIEAMKWAEAPAIIDAFTALDIRLATPVRSPSRQSPLHHPRPPLTPREWAK